MVIIDAREEHKRDRLQIGNLPHLLKQLKAVRSRHHQIRDHNARLQCLDGLQCSVGSVRSFHLETALGETGLCGSQHCRLVVNEQHQFVFEHRWIGKNDQ